LIKRKLNLTIEPKLKPFNHDTGYILWTLHTFFAAKLITVHVVNSLWQHFWQCTVREMIQSHSVVIQLDAKECTTTT